MLKQLTIHLTILSVFVILTGCGSSKSTRATGTYKQDEKTISDMQHTASTPQAAALLKEARSWLGTPYKYGGNDRKGVDCSGLVLQIYKAALGIPLPRSSREQRDYCTSISKSNLIPGDLIFFATGKDRKKISHVGIFIGESRMIHASASKGVILSDISAPYYTRTYVGSGMVDKYHAMIGEDLKKHNDENTPIISQIESPTGFTLTPVDKLPEPKNKKDTAQAEHPTRTDNPASGENTVRSDSTLTQQSHTAKPLHTVRAESSATATPSEQTSAEQARTAVLNSIKEKDLK